MRKTIASIIIFIIGLCGIEQYLVHFAPQSGWCPINHEWKEDDPVLPYKPKPNYKGRMIQKGQFDVPLTINSEGLRGPEIGKGKKRVHIGDSFIFGWGVSDEEVCIRKLKSKYEEINLGCYGMDISEYAEIFRRCLKSSPSEIYIWFYVGNDFDWRPLKTEVQETQGGSSPNKIKEWVNNKQIVIFFRERLYQRFPATRKWLMKLGIISVSDIYSEDMPQWKLDKTKEVLAEMKKVCDKKKIKLTVVAIPTREQVYWSETIDKMKLDHTLPQQRLKKICAELNIPILDLLPHFQECKDERLYYETDPHWTAIGHELAAEIINGKT